MIKSINKERIDKIIGADSRYFGWPWIIGASGAVFGTGQTLLDGLFRARQFLFDYLNEPADLSERVCVGLCLVAGEWKAVINDIDKDKLGIDTDDLDEILYAIADRNERIRERMLEEGLDIGTNRGRIKR